MLPNKYVDNFLVMEILFPSLIISTTDYSTPAAKKTREFFSYNGSWVLQSSGSSNTTLVQHSSVPETGKKYGAFRFGFNVCLLP
jgi:hypothetical protein